ncbi:hypothetical protein OIU78_006754 [Salix suchowensis]|nr:hypothetical protein OIU78_006754 [Salix suchowensis]
MLNYACWVKQQLIQRLFSLSLMIKLSTRFNLVLVTIFLKPSRAAIQKSLEQLFLLGALTDDCKLSDPVGHQMARLPLDPIYSKALILASQFNCLEEMLIAVSMLSVESIFYNPREKSAEAKNCKEVFCKSRW